jgi:uncharacterized protein YbjQ (UPF0145 family)
MQGALPERPFLEVAQIDVHAEATHFLNPRLEDVLPELKKKACLAGADAIVNLEERRSSHLETRSYHVTATAISFR